MFSPGALETFQDNYTALYFIGCRGEEVIHHLPCLVHKLTVQRLTLGMAWLRSWEGLEYLEWGAQMLQMAGKRIVDVYRLMAHGKTN